MIVDSIIVSAALGLVALASEWLARWWIRHRSRYYVMPPGLRVRLSPHPDVSPYLEPCIRFDANGDGERGPAVPRSAKGLCRFLVVGGSQPEGYLLDQDTHWPGALQRLLERPEHLQRLRASRVHVGNISRSGVGSEALDLILQRVLPRYPRLSTIIVLVGASDVLRWLEYGAPPSPPPPVRASEVFRCHPELTFGWRPRRLALVELALRLRHRWIRPLQVHDRACSWIVRARAMRARATSVRTVIPDAGPMLAHFEHHLRRALQRATTHADRVIVVRQPWFNRPCTPQEMDLLWHGGVGQAWQEDVTTFYSTEVLSSLMTSLDARAERVARELGLEQVDLMPILHPSVETYYDFFHATPAGSRVITAAVAAAVLRTPFSCVAPPDVAALSAPDAGLIRKVS